MRRVEINHNAPVVSTQEILVAAPLERVWAEHTRIPDWPTWNPGITRAELKEPLKVGTRFDWETAGMAISSTVQELVPGRRIVWSGTVDGILGIHAWEFTPRGGAVLVRSEESWEGGVAAEKAPQLQKSLDSFLAAWLEHLKAHTERISGTGAH